MRQALILVVAVCFLVALVFEPRSDADGAPARPSADERAASLRAAIKERDEASADADWYSRATVLPRAGDGHFYADVTINGQPVHALVDTGASVVALTESDARAMGIAWDPAEVGVVGSGASGEVRGVPVTIAEIKLGSHHASNVEGVVITDGLGVTLLGQSFLSTINPVRIENDTLILGR